LYSYHTLFKRYPVKLFITVFPTILNLLKRILIINASE